MFHQIIRSAKFQFYIVVLFIALSPFIMYGILYKTLDLGGGPSVHPTPTLTPTPKIIDLPLTFHGTEVQFTYNQYGGKGERLTTQILGGKIYLGPKGNVAAGSYIEVFSKASDQTLSKAIKQQLLKGYDENNCYISEQSYPPTDTYKDGYSIAQIVTDNAHDCPQPYSDDKNNSFFLIDYSQPQKFAFIYEGRDAIGGFADGKSWVSTLQIH